MSTASLGIDLGHYLICRLDGHATADCQRKNCKPLGQFPTWQLLVQNRRMLFGQGTLFRHPAHAAMACASSRHLFFVLDVSDQNFGSQNQRDLGPNHGDW